MCCAPFHCVHAVLAPTGRCSCCLHPAPIRLASRSLGICCLPPRNPSTDRCCTVRLAAAQVWEAAEPLGLKSKRFTKQMLVQVSGWAADAPLLPTTRSSRAPCAPQAPKSSMPLQGCRNVRQLGGLLRPAGWSLSCCHPLLPLAPLQLRKAGYVQAKPLPASKTKKHAKRFGYCLSPQQQQAAQQAAQRQRPAA